MKTPLHSLAIAFFVSLVLAPLAFAQNPIRIATYNIRFFSTKVQLVAPA